MYNKCLVELFQGLYARRENRCQTKWFFSSVSSHRDRSVISTIIDNYLLLSNDSIYWLIECPTCGQFKALQNSVIRLENVIQKLTQRVSLLQRDITPELVFGWKSIFLWQLIETELRLQSVEECDCFKSCSVNGSLHPEGSTWKQDCDICSCVVSISTLLSFRSHFIWFYLFVWMKSAEKWSVVQSIVRFSVRTQN